MLLLQLPLKAQAPSTNTFSQCRIGLVKPTRLQAKSSPLCEEPGLREKHHTAHKGTEVSLHPQTNPTVCCDGSTCVHQPVPKSRAVILPAGGLVPFIKFHFWPISCIIYSHPSCFQRSQDHPFSCPKNGALVAHDNVNNKSQNHLG